MNKINNKKYLLFLLIIILLITVSGCAAIKDKISQKKGELIGQHFNINVYDDYSNKTLSMEGKKVSIEIFEDKSGNVLREDEVEYDSSVLEITVNGNQIIQVGNTIVFEEDGLRMIEDYDLPNRIEYEKGGKLIPVDRYINNLKNKIGKEKVVIIFSGKGVPIGVYEGKKVFVTVPKNLPKMTRLNIDGKSLYIHRANYMILDKDVIK